jgi:hypothetical protein
MNLWLQRSLLALVLCWSTATKTAAADPSIAPISAPSSRPRLTEALRAKVENERVREIAKEVSAATMEKVIVRETRLPSGPPKELQQVEPFSITRGGYVFKKNGERLSIEVGLWRHIEVVDDPRDELRDTERIRMGLLRISW